MRLFAGTPFDRPPTCERCGQLETDCTCLKGPAAFLAPEKQTARLAVEKRKKGKVVTVVRGLAAEANDLPALLRKMKAQCGAGGTIDGDALELQGDHIERLASALVELGYRVRR